MSDLVALRRMQIVNAAENVISEKGLQYLSLAEIEKKAGMSRGQLTYYFPTKEEILLAVFDRCVENIHRRIAVPLETISKSGVKGWALVKQVISAAEKAVGHKIPSVASGRRSGDPAVLIADISKARKYLNWQPTREINQMVLDTWKSMQ